MHTLVLAITLFLAGVLTILLPCILPLVPIVLGVSVSGQSRWRPLLVILGMVMSFVAFTFALNLVFRHVAAAADTLRIATFAVLLLFGIGFFTGNRFLRLVGAVAAALFFLDHGPIAVLIAAILTIAAMEASGWVATRIQQTGSDVQQSARLHFGAESPLTAFLIGLTLGLVWVPCAGPALGFAFSLVRDEPGLRAMFLLTTYALGTAMPLLLVGYGGQWAVRSVRLLNRYTGLVKRAAGVLLILTAIALQLRVFERLQIWLLDHTPFGDLGTRLEEVFLGNVFDVSQPDMPIPGDSSPSTMMLPRLNRAPELASDGPWHNLHAGSGALTMQSLRGTVVLIDFWTYSCINCIRTLPYIQGYWEKYHDMPFVLIGVHTPEFAFEGVPENVAAAIERHGLTYPIVQDNEYGTWRAFANRYWPAKYLIDAEGYIRYTHFGEGGYDETDAAISSLLAEIGVKTSDTPPTDDVPTISARSRSPETYLGARSWPALANAQGDPTAETVTYTAPTDLALNRYALVGDWQMLDGERQVLRSDTGEIRMRWEGSDINLVLGLEEGATPVEAEVWIDGIMTKKFLVDRHDLYVLSTGDYGEHDLMLKFVGSGVEGYAFTFGS